MNAKENFDKRTGKEKRMKEKWIRKERNVENNYERKQLMKEKEKK